MTLFLQQLIGGLTVGGMYAFLALALVFSFRSTGVVNFAQGEMAMFSAYLAWQLTAWGVPFYLAVLLTVIASFLIGGAVYGVLIKPVPASAHLAVVGVTIGLFLCLNGLAQYIWTGLGKSFPGFIQGEPFRFGGLVVGLDALSVVVLLAATLGLLYLVFEHTKLGLGMRAAAAATQESRLVGIRVTQMFLLGWGIAAAIGALAGVTVAPRLTLSPDMMLTTIIYAFAAATLGGFSSIAGAVIGGLLVGVVENLASTYIPFVTGDMRIFVALVIIMGVLLVRPSGLFGKPEGVRL
ncbi:branched-chain amino acid ABC transporter permease [Micromonospora sonneratiae]|uniref:Branched-chain amino acid ABC transporter permease n=1 Tax=Micromonospora sonneratiae TaxID=1184706 RepID=A0ABW3Y9Y9_9ACTN